MAVKRYEVEQDMGKGRKVTTILKLNDADAKRLGLFKEPKPPAKKAAVKPANKARTAANKKG